MVSCSINRVGDNAIPPNASDTRCTNIMDVSESASFRRFPARRPSSSSNTSGINWRRMRSTTSSDSLHIRSSSMKLALRFLLRVDRVRSDLLVTPQSPPRVWWLPSAPHSITVAPQFKPAPKAAITMILPGLRCPASTASLSSSGSDAAPILPTLLMLESMRSPGTPSSSATACKILEFAWCNMNQSAAPGDKDAAASTERMTRGTSCVAKAKTSAPRICKLP
mmetsp:Transcript_135808/g.434485  ORF Transcript_135808/g.434485 Transcript_135808/m.434485 type:complete len:223 (-) Transcript_135808:857-1525(-)